MPFAQPVLLLAVVSAISVLSAQPRALVENIDVAPALEVPSPENVDGPIIQLALLLDTSNSMDGLINQARTRLWSIVNEMSAIAVAGEVPQLQVALYQYGNSGISAGEDHVQLRCRFTTDLDIVSEQLFALSTNGGNEYCGAVLREALTELSWVGTGRKHVLRLVVIAGNEPFNQGTEPFGEWTSHAMKRDIRINTIFCGPEQEGRRTLWEQGALSGNGYYAFINQDYQEPQIETPFDDALKQLNDALNGTYIGYGRRGAESLKRQEMQDQFNASASVSGFFSRVLSKSSSNYATGSWDLVSGVEDGSIALEDIDSKSLPEEYRGLSPVELEQRIDLLVIERTRIQNEIVEVSKKRREFIKQALTNQNASESERLDDALIRALLKQAVEAGF